MPSIPEEEVVELATAEFETYEPQGVLLDIEQCFIFDAAEFAAAYNTTCVRYNVDGKKNLEVLDSITGDWIDVTAYHKRKQKAQVKSIK